MARIDGGVVVNVFHVVLESLVGAVGLSTVALERLVPFVYVLVHQPVLVVEEGLAAERAHVRAPFALHLMIPLDVRQQVFLQ